MDPKKAGNLELSEVQEPVLEPGEKAEEERKFYVYVLRRPDKVDPFDETKGQPFYVGKGSNRWKGSHKRSNGHRQEAQKMLHKDCKKGIKLLVIHKLWKQELDFTEEIYTNNLDEKQAFNFERQLIKKYGRIDNGTGILANHTDGGEGMSGATVSKETRQKISKFHKGKKKSPEHCKKLQGKTRSPESCKKMSEYSKNRSPEHIKKISETLRGKEIPLSVRKKMSETLKGRAPWNKGLKLSPEHCRKISEGQKGRKFSDEHRQRIGARHKGKFVSAETRKKLSEAAINYRNTLHKS